MPKEIAASMQGSGEYDDRRGLEDYLKAKEYEGCTILTRRAVLPIDWRTSGANNNVVVFGSPNSGKSWNVLGPNIMQARESLIVIDPKGALYGRYAPGLRESGYKVDLLDFKDPGRSTCGWNPFSRAGDEQGVYRVCEQIVTAHGANARDPFWDVSAMQLLEALALMARDQATGRVDFRRMIELSRLLYEPSVPDDYMQIESERERGRCALDDYVDSRWGSRRLERRIRAAEREYKDLSSRRERLVRAARKRGLWYPGMQATRLDSERYAAYRSYARKERRLRVRALAVSQRAARLRLRRSRISERGAHLWRMVRESADNTWRSIRVEMDAHLQPLTHEGMVEVLSATGCDDYDFARLGRRKAALFVSISDTDRSMDFLAKMCVSQAVDALAKHADSECGGCLPQPVRVVIDDFATMGAFPGVASWVNSLRSRNVGLVLVCQSMAQLAGVYGREAAEALVAACDSALFVGAQNDPSTASYIGRRAGLPVAAPTWNGCAWAFVRGYRPHVGLLYDPMHHPNFAHFEVARWTQGTPSWTHWHRLHAPASEWNLGADWPPVVRS